MSVPAVGMEALRPPPRRKREPLVYVVEVEPSEPDPKAAAAVLRWLQARMR